MFRLMRISNFDHRCCRISLFYLLLFVNRGINFSLDSFALQYLIHAYIYIIKQ